MLNDFVHHNAIFEKYDVVHRGSNVSTGLRFGYTSNEVGFGWTNVTFEELYAELPAQMKPRVLNLGGIPVPSKEMTKR